jgi:hypothetical protein
MISVTVPKMLWIPLSHYHEAQSFATARKRHFSYHAARLCYRRYHHTLKIVEEVPELSLPCPVPIIIAMFQCQCHCRCRFPVPIVIVQVLFVDLTLCRI